MAKGTIRVNSILDGQQTTEYFGTKAQFLNSIGIDPDLAGSTTGVKASGVITPSVYTEFSGSAIDGNVIAIITNPKDTNIYVVQDNGDLISYSSVLGSETLIGTVTGNEAKGAFYYNNYIYITGTGANQTDVSRYGPLDGTPTLANAVWTGSTLGSQTALGNVPYPAAGGVSYPSHWGHVHSDGQAYFFDFVPSTGATATAGKGLIHAINTTKGTAEGDTNNGSAYNVLDLPFGYMPTDIESYGTDLVISAIQTTDTILNQGPSALFFWDTTDTDSFYRQVDLKEFPLVTALQNKGGRLYVFSGNRVSGHSVGIYDGAYAVEPIEFFPDGYSPFPGGVDVYGNRISWGSSITDPAARAVVLSLGYKSPRLNRNAIHGIAVASVTESTPTTTAINYARQSSGINPTLIIASRAGTGGATQFNLDRLDLSATQNSTIQLGPFNVGEPFKITKLRLLLDELVSNGVVITPTFRFDDFSSTYVLDTINNTNFSGERNIVYKTPRLARTQSGIQAQGEHNFILELAFTGTIHTSVLFPITIEIDSITD